MVEPLMRTDQEMAVAELGTMAFFFVRSCGAVLSNVDMSYFVWIMR